MRKAFSKYGHGDQFSTDPEELWKHLMLLPKDYTSNAIFNETTRRIMELIQFEHGGKEFDEQYPKGLPTSISITTKEGKQYDSGMILYPGGHAMNETVSLSEILRHKFVRLGQLSLEKDELYQFVMQLENIGDLTNEQLQSIYECSIKFADESVDEEQKSE